MYALFLNGTDLLDRRLRFRKVSKCSNKSSVIYQHLRLNMLITGVIIVELYGKKTVHLCKGVIETCNGCFFEAFNIICSKYCLKPLKNNIKICVNDLQLNDNVLF